MAQKKVTVAEAKAQGKFATMIMRDGDAVAEGRGKRAIESAKAAQKKLVLDLEDKIRKVEDQKELMLDNSPDNRFSLNIGANFDAQKFTDEYQALSIKLINLRVELTIAQENSEDLFGA